mgnify:FL=1
MHSTGLLFVRDDGGKCRKLFQLAEVIKPDEVKGKKVISLEVCDPRLNQSERLLMLDPSSLGRMESKISSSFGEVAHPDFINRTPGEEEIHGYYSNIEVINTLWNSKSKKPNPPLKEKFLSKMRHIIRLHAFGLSEPGTFNSGRKLGISKTLCDRSSCPILLLKHDDVKPSACG